MYLIVFIESCRALRDVVTIGSQKPYVSAQLLGKKFTTGNEEEAHEPNFNHHLVEWNINEVDDAVRDQDIYFSVRHDGVTGSKTIGSATIKVGAFEGGLDQHWVNLMDGDNIMGQLCVSGRFDEMAESYRRLLEDPTPSVWVFCHGGRNIRDKTTFSTQKPFLKVQCAGTTKQTGPAGNSETSPDWAGMCLRFPVGDGYDVETPVYISCRAEGTVSVINLGNAQIRVGKFEEGFDNEWFPLEGGGEVQLSGLLNDFKKRQREEEEREAARIAAAEAAAAAEAERLAAAEAARKAAEERRRQLEEAQRQAELAAAEAAEEERERLAAELEAAREAARLQAEAEAARIAEEARRAEAARRAEEERKRRDEEARRAQEAARRAQEEAARRAMEAHQREVERMRRELEAAQAEAARVQAEAEAAAAAAETKVEEDNSMHGWARQWNGKVARLRNVKTGKFMWVGPEDDCGTRCGPDHDTQFTIRFDEDRKALTFQSWHNNEFATMADNKMYGKGGPTDDSYFELLPVEIGLRRFHLRCVTNYQFPSVDGDRLHGVVGVARHKELWEFVTEDGFNGCVSADSPDAVRARNRHFMLQWHGHRAFVQETTYGRFLSLQGSENAPLKVEGHMEACEEVEFTFEWAGALRLRFVRLGGSLSGGEDGQVWGRKRDGNEWDIWRVILVNEVEGVFMLQSVTGNRYLRVCGDCSFRLHEEHGGDEFKFKFVASDGFKPQTMTQRLTGPEARDAAKKAAALAAANAVKAARAASAMAKNLKFW